MKQIKSAKALRKAVTVTTTYHTSLHRDGPQYDSGMWRGWPWYLGLKHKQASNLKLQSFLVTLDTNLGQLRGRCDWTVWTVQSLARNRGDSNDLIGAPVAESQFIGADWADDRESQQEAIDCLIELQAHLQYLNHI